MNACLRILIVDDNPADADYLRELLPETGPVTFQIESVVRLAEALTRLQGNTTDLVLLDLGLPDSQGLPTFQQLRQAVPDIPVIVLTGTDDQELAVAAVRDGAQDFLVKGQFSGSLLTRAIRYARERQQAEQTMREWNQTLENRVAERTKELRQSEARFRQIAEITFEGIAISESGVLLDGNARLAELFGYELAEMIGSPVARFLTPKARNLTARRVRDSGGMTYEVVGVRKNGSTFPVEVHTRMRTFQGRKLRCSALRDLSAVKLAAARMRVQQTELEQAHRLALVSEVSAGIIHQLGQPLFTMGANVAVALESLKGCGLQASSSWEILKDIEAGVACMRDIVSHLRSLTHPEQSNRARLDLNQLVEGVIHLLRQEADNRQVQLAVRYGRDLPPVRADAVQLSQVILNLARNAFDTYADCPREPRTVEIMTRAVTGDGVELSVRDSGTGLAPAVMARLFTPFFTTKPEGLGIGLRLSQTIVEAHGGRIEANNNADGSGATFRVVLPAAPE